MENNRFLLDSDYLEIITKEALEQIIQPGNEYKFIQAEELAEMSILENLVEVRLSGCMIEGSTIP